MSNQYKIKLDGIHIILFKYFRLVQPIEAIMQIWIDIIIITMPQ